MVIFIDPDVVADKKLGALVSELFIWMLEEGDVVLCACLVSALTVICG